MRFSFLIRTLPVLLLLGSGFSAIAQDQEPDELPPPTAQPKSRLLTGFFVGSYFANKYSASAYNGYGFDVDGNPNSFLNSLIYQKIYYEYGGGYGFTDQVAQALGVDPGQWQFTESDMPINMHYQPVIMAGFNFKIPLLDKRNAIIANINGAKIGVEGNFTISVKTPSSSPNPAANNNIRTCTITGREQRLLFQLGMQRILGDDEKLNFFVEAGAIGSLAKFDRNTVYINNLVIDLTYYSNQAVYPTIGPFKRPVGFALGAFAGAGLNIEANPRITVQLLYTLSDEKIKIGTNPVHKVQHTIGLRAYYNFRDKKAVTEEPKGL